MSNTILQLNNVWTENRSSTGVKHILQGVSLSLHKNEILAIVGESGCGKSMTLQTILQLLPNNICITGGCVQFGNRDLTKMSPREIIPIRGKEIGIIFQDPIRSLDPTMTIGLQLLTTIYAHTNTNKINAKKLAISTLRAVGFNEPDKIFNRYPHTLSGGQCQRAMIAIALVLSPSLLLADEPTTSLDKVAQHEILQLLRSIKEKQDVSILFVSHDLQAVSFIADRIAVMYQGKIVEIGRTQQIFSNPRHPYTNNLLASILTNSSTPKTPMSSYQKTNHIPASQTGCTYAHLCPEAIDCCFYAPPKYYESADSHGCICWLDSGLE